MLICFGDKGCIRFCASECMQKLWLRPTALLRPLGAVIPPHRPTVSRLTKVSVHVSPRPCEIACAWLELKSSALCLTFGDLPRGPLPPAISVPGVVKRLAQALHITSGLGRVKLAEYSNRVTDGCRCSLSQQVNPSYSVSIIFSTTFMPFSGSAAESNNVALLLSSAHESRRAQPRSPKSGHGTRLMQSI